MIRVQLGAHELCGMSSRKRAQGCIVIVQCRLEVLLLFGTGGLPYTRYSGLHSFRIIHCGLAVMAYQHLVWECPGAVTVCTFPSSGNLLPRGLRVLYVEGAFLEVLINPCVYGRIFSKNILSYGYRPSIGRVIPVLGPRLQ